MIENLETLEALYQHKTMMKAATALRITQSSVSKRIANLENQIGKQLIQKSGRRVLLTYEAKKILDKVLPHLIGIKEAIEEDGNQTLPRLTVGFSESILSSWGAKSLSNFYKEFDGLELIPHAHRSPVVIDRVRSGEYLLGVCAGYCAKAPDLYIKEIGYENFVLIKSKNQNRRLPLMTIETASETWQAIESQAKRGKIKPDARLESFGAIAQLAKVGLVNALVPAGIARYISPSKISKDKMAIEKLIIRRPIIIIGRKTMFSRKDLKIYIDGLEKLLVKELGYINNYYK